MNTLTPTIADTQTAHEIVTLRDRDTCQRCHDNCGPTTRVHRLAGGPTIPANLHTLGLGCRTWATDNPTAAVLEGWAIPAWIDPESIDEWPAARWFRGDFDVMTIGWVLYDNAGRFREITEGDAMERMA